MLWNELKGLNPQITSNQQGKKNVKITVLSVPTTSQIARSHFHVHVWVSLLKLLHIDQHWVPLGLSEL